jgi:hypothetical protein
MGAQATSSAARIEDKLSRDQEKWKELTERCEDLSDIHNIAIGVLIEL